MLAQAQDSTPLLVLTAGSIIVLMQLCALKEIEVENDMPFETAKED